jgi:hypothetical protein
MAPSAVDQHKPSRKPEGWNLRSGASASDLFHSKAAEPVVDLLFRILHQ